MQLLELREHGARICAPPARTGDHDVIVLADIIQIFLQFRAGIVTLLLLGDLSALHVIHRVILNGLYLKKVGIYRVANVFRDQLGIANLEVLYLSVHIVLSPAGIIDNKIFCHNNTLECRGSRLIESLQLCFRALHEFVDVDDEALMQAFTDRAGVIKSRHSEYQPASVDLDKLAFAADVRSDRARRKVAHVDMGTDGGPALFHIRLDALPSGHLHQAYHVRSRKDKLTAAARGSRRLIHRYSQFPVIPDSCN